jgi:hypothetical protein
MLMRTPIRDLALGCSACLLLISLLACSVPQNNKAVKSDKSTPSYKLGAQPNRTAPEAREEKSEVASPQDALADEAHSSKLHGAKTPLEARCDNGEAQACHDFALSTLAVSTEPAMTSRAAMAMFRACDLEHKKACYDYALMVWMQVGVDYDGQEIAFSLERARRLKDRRAEHSYEELIRPPAPGSLPMADTMKYYKNACEISLVPACDALEEFERVKEAAKAAPPERAAETTPDGLPVIGGGSPAKMTDVGLSVAGGISTKEVKAALEPRRAQLRFCYERGLAKNPALEGVLVTTVSVKPDGSVASVIFDGSTIQDAGVMECMTELVRRWKFEAPKNKKETLIVYMAEFASE